MASKFMRGQKWWIKLRHPATGRLIRESLETADVARAELLRQRIALEVALLEPRFGAAEIPAHLREQLALRVHAAAVVPIREEVEPSMKGLAATPSTPRTTVDAAISAYLKFITTDNAPRHAEN